MGETIDCLSNVVRRDSNSEKHAKPLGRFAGFQQAALTIALNGKSESGPGGL
jgi:hypothetical protein